MQLALGEKRNAQMVGHSAPSYLLGAGVLEKHAVSY